MPIYTKKGDKGETGLFDGTRILKSSIRIESIGALDQSTCYIGWAREQVEDEKVRGLLSDIQHDLYELMGALAGAKLEKAKFKRRISRFERTIDAITLTLPKLNRFILPQGSEAATRLHIARTMVRNAERRVVVVKNFDKEPPKDIDVVIQYVNRLSDLLFTLARKFAQVEKVT